MTSPRYKLEDLPAALRVQAEAKLKDKYTMQRTMRCRKPQKLRIPKGPNETERAYRALYLSGKDARYEALTFHMKNTHKYTPDWVVCEDGLPVECHECKGEYRFGSQGRSRLAFDQCCKEFPGLNWFWNGRLVT